MDRILFIGPAGHGKIPTNGASIKNNFILSRLKEEGCKVKLVDTEDWKKNILIIFKVLLFLIVYRKSQIIVSTSAVSAYRILWVSAKIGAISRITYWVIGGGLYDKIFNHQFNPEVYRKAKCLIVEGEALKKELKRLGIENVLLLPNFKYIKELPSLRDNNNKKIQFVFLSRIIPEKGCDLIIESSLMLNKKGYKSLFSVSFYGKIDANYELQFEKKIKDIPNVKYEGFLDLRDFDNYQTLAQYDIFLFPTYWPTEGFPGIVIDAMIAGLPVIASKWNLNEEVISENKTGFFIEPKNIEALMEKMEDIILHPAIARKMRIKCQREAEKYDTRNIISRSFLKSNGLLH